MDINGREKAKRFWIVASLLGICMFVTAIFCFFHTEKNEAEKRMVEIVNYVKVQCSTYTHYNESSESKSLLRAIESARQMSTNINMETENGRQLSRDFLKENLQTLWVNGIIVLDTEGKIDCEYSTDESLANEITEYLQKEIIMDFVGYEERSYSERINRKDGSHIDIAACARKDAPGMVAIYYYTSPEFVRNYTLTIQNLLNGYSTQKDGTIIVADKGTIVASNDESLLGQDTAGNQVEYEIGIRSVTKYTYDGRHRVSTVSVYNFLGTWGEDYFGFDPDTSDKTLRTVTLYDYDDYGLITNIRTTSYKTENGTTTAESALNTSRTYDTASGSRIFGALLSETDTLGRTTKYFYDENNGYLLAAIGADGNGTAYSYDALGRMNLALPAKISSSGTDYTEVLNSAQATYSYLYGRLGCISTKTANYTFNYDEFGNTSSIQWNAASIVSYTYNEYNGKLDTLSYANGTLVKYVYDELDRVKEICYKYSSTSDYTTAYAYTYDANGYLHKFTDHISGQITVYKYDKSGRLQEYYVNKSDGDMSQTALVNDYDDEGRLIGIDYQRDYTCPDGIYVLQGKKTFAYKDDGSLFRTGIYYDSFQYEISYTYDRLGRVSTDTTILSYASPTSESPEVTNTYTYAPYNGNTSLRISGVTTQYSAGSTSVSEAYSYVYNTAGYIKQIYKNGVLQYSYDYDDLGQLIRENNAAVGRTYLYTYDNGGNLLSKKEYGYTTADTVSTTLYDTVTYAYESNIGRKDLLTSYDGNSISYDANGNPYSYPKNGKTYMMYWTQGRRLQAMSSGTSDNLSFTYNADGIRTSKTVNGVKHIYALSGSTVLSEEWTENGVQHLIIYAYDTAGSPIGMLYRNSTYLESFFDSYLFGKNIQGDILYIYDKNGNRLVSYTYDAWGNILSTVYSNGGASTSARFNPLRYRGYYYDTETGLYYLNSRYYDSVAGRFINADEIINGNVEIAMFL